MSEILSQEEINSLLSAYQSVNASGPGTLHAEKRDKEVRIYDFSRPDRFSKEHMRTLEVIHSNFAQSLNAVLYGICQVAMQVNLICLDQVPYKDYRSLIPAKTLLAEVVAEPFKGDILMEISPVIIGVLIDFMCGGSHQLPSNPSDLTQIDLALITSVLRIFLQAYADTWAGTLTLSPQIRRVVDSETFEDSLLPSEVILVCSLEILYGQTSGMMTLCIPAAGIESVLPNLSASRFSKNSTRWKNDLSTGHLKRTLEAINLPCSVVLGDTDITFLEAMNLEVGDVIKTANRVDSPVDLRVGDRSLFHCRPGLKGSNLGVVVSGFAGKDESS